MYELPININVTRKEADAFRVLAQREANRAQRAADRAEQRRADLDEKRWKFQNLADKLYY